MRPASYSNLLLALAVLALLAAALFFGAAVWFTLGARGQASAAEDAAAQASTDVQSLGQEAQMADRTAPERAALAALVIPAGGDAAFISNLEGLGAAAGVSDTVASVSSAAPVGSAPGSLSLSLQATGSYSACLRFLKLVETVHAAESVSNVSLAYDSSAKAWQETLSVTVLSYDSP